MKTILFPTDFSNNSINAIKFGATLLKNEKFKMILFNTYDLPVIPTTDQSVMPVNYVAELVESSEIGLKRIKSIVKELFDTSNITIELVSKMGPLQGAVKDYLEDVHVDLIVMGTHGSSGLKRVLIGSNTFDIMKIADCPVLSVPVDYKFTDLKNIIFSTDLQPISNINRLEPIKWVAKKYGSKVNILNVITDNSKTNENSAAESLKIDGFLKDIDHHFYFSENENIDEGIMDSVNKNKCDMLVMVIHDLNFFERLFHPSVTKKVVMQVNKPLLTLHA